MIKSNPDDLFDRLSSGDHMTDEMLLEVHGLLNQALELGLRLGTRGEVLRTWAGSHLYDLAEIIQSKGFEVPGENHTGLRLYRLKSNPQEQVFADRWQELNKDPSNMLDHLMADDPNGRCQEPSPLRDKLVAATVIQWLGSPVGQGFLRDCGYVKEKK